jgi:hypothetical protein
MVQVVECLLCKLEVMSSDPRPPSRAGGGDQGYSAYLARERLWVQFLVAQTTKTKQKQQKNTMKTGRIFRFLKIKKKI